MNFLMLTKTYLSGLVFELIICIVPRLDSKLLVIASVSAETDSMFCDEVFGETVEAKGSKNLKVLNFLSSMQKNVYVGRNDNILCVFDFFVPSSSHPSE